MSKEEKDSCHGESELCHFFGTASFISGAASQTWASVELPQGSYFSLALPISTRMGLAELQTSLCH